MDGDSNFTAQMAGELCHVRGYIMQKSNPEIKLWKNTVGFYSCLKDLHGNDWDHYDPEGSETTIVG